jgi:polyphosphate glucokinase
MSRRKSTVKSRSARAAKPVPGADKLRVLVIDIGGTGIKMIAMNGRGKSVTERTRELTPKPSTPEAVMGVIRDMLPAHGRFDRVSVGFPGVVMHGTVQTAPNLGGSPWHGFDLQKTIGAITGKPTRAINDADLQGFGVITGDGVEIVLTLGTGLGCGLYINGHLVPNLELAHHPFGDRKQRTYEQLVSDATLKKIGKKKWQKRMVAIIRQLESIFNFDRLHIGGGNARHLDSALPQNVRVFDSTLALAGGVRMWHDPA